MSGSGVQSHIKCLKIKNSSEPLNLATRLKKKIAPYNKLGVTELVFELKLSNAKLKGAFLQVVLLLW